MRLDEQTARDLEIFHAQGGAPSLFDSLDRTRTQGGREALRARFQRPFAEAGRIRAVQASLRFIQENREAFARIPAETELSALNRYLRSNLVLAATTRGPAAALEALWTRIAYRDLYDEAAAGVTLTRKVLEAMAALAATPELARVPGELGELLGELRTGLAGRDIAFIRDLRLRHGWWPQVLRLDRTIREDARPGIERLVSVIYELDALVSMADVTSERGLTFPEVVEGAGEVIAEGVYHPFLVRPVPNDLELDQRRRLLFLTGPNMAGKTTHLRACGIALYLAHLGMGVPARRLRFSPFDVLLSAIGLVDDVRAGVSFFRAEALRMKQVARALAEGARVFGIVDEPFKGTNVRDALDASREVLLRLARAQGSVFLVSSHLIELGDALQSLPAVVSQKFEAEEGGGELRYDYVARPGISSQRLGMRVLEEEGVFELFDQAPV